MEGFLKKNSRNIRIQMLKKMCENQEQSQPKQRESVTFRFKLLSPLETVMICTAPFDANASKKRASG